MRPDPSAICFGLDTDHDRSSCAVYLQLFGNRLLAETLSQRMDSQEIDQLVDHCTGLLRKHLSEPEYHALFLQDGDLHPTECHD